jgi:uncharacterized membrane protein YcaP (DUF421 family)
MESYLIHATEHSTIVALKPLLKKLKVKIERVDLPYNPEYVAMIKQGQEDIKNGKGIKMTLNELKELCK